MIETHFVATSVKMWPGASKKRGRAARLLAEEAGQEGGDLGAARLGAGAGQAGRWRVRRADGAQHAGLRVEGRVQPGAVAHSPSGSRNGASASRSGAAAVGRRVPGQGEAAVPCGRHSRGVSITSSSASAVAGPSPDSDR